MAKKITGTILYYVVCERESIQTGGKSVYTVGSSYRTRREAEAKKIEQAEAVGNPEYEYKYRIEARDILLSNGKNKRS